MLVDVDAIWYSIRPLGRFQLTRYFLLLLFNLPNCWIFFTPEFQGYIPEHRCRVPFGDTNDTAVNATIPWECVTTRTNRTTCRQSRCQQYSDTTYRNQTDTCRHGWYFYADTDSAYLHGESYVAEWELVCGKSALVETLQSLFFAGIVVGTLFIPWFSDNYGRKRTFTTCILLYTPISVGAAFVRDYTLMAVARFLFGMLSSSASFVMQILVTELFPCPYRARAYQGVYGFWFLAMLTLPLISYGTRDWRYLQLCVSLPCALLVCLMYFVPESLHYLSTHARLDEIRRIVGEASKENGVTEPDLRQLVRGDSAAGGKAADGDLQDYKAPNKKYTLIDAFRHPILRVHALLLAYVCIADNLVYFGVSLSTELLPRDRFTNFFLSALVEGPAYLLNAFMLDRIGRRRSVIIVHMLAVVSLISSSLISYAANEGGGSDQDLSTLHITFSLLGKFAATSAFGIVYFYSTEVYPTVMRTIGIGFTAMAGRVGSITAPFSIYLADISSFAQPVTFAVMALLAAGAATLLPETKGRVLPQTLADLDDMYARGQNDNVSRTKQYGTMRA